MAEFALASNLLSTIASPEFRKAYDRVSFTVDLNELTPIIEKIQPVLLDAQKKQQTNAAVKNWIERVRDVLYDADDLFDEVATDYILHKPIKRENYPFFSKVNLSTSIPPIGGSITTKVKRITNTLLEILDDRIFFSFEIFAKLEPAKMTRRVDLWSFVDPNNVIGRDQDKRALLKMLFDESIDDGLPVTAIVGIGGIGKTTLSQLIYNDEEVAVNFEQRWFACLSKASDEKQILGKIFQSIRGENFTDFSVSQLNSKIQDSVKDTKYLLVLDDVWGDHGKTWPDQWRMLLGGAKGSRIIVTTRSLSFAKAVNAFEYKLDVLSDEESWELFKREAFTLEQETDPIWHRLGREILERCRGVPLLIRSVASLLYTKATPHEWESFIVEEKRVLYGDDPILDTLKLSYDHLPSSMKPCFAYCSLFPKDSEFEIKKLVHLWIAQGYVNLSLKGETIEQVGYSYFMDLLTRGLFQEAKVDEYGEVVSCKMHELVHDMAQEVAGKDILLTQPFNQFVDRERHVGVDCEMGDPGEILQRRLLYGKRLRSLVLMNGDSCVKALDLQFANLKLLRALSLSDLEIGNVSDSIGKLKLLRYLDLSHNSFASLPDSMMNLVNLLTLDIEGCYNLKQLPVKFRKLVKLRCLNNKYCYELMHMPPRIGELACLQYLSSFKVGKPTQGVQWSGLDALAGLTQLTGELRIDFETGIEHWKEDESWQLPVSPQRLHIWEYPGRRIPRWGSERTCKLSHLDLGSCSKVRYLPPLRSLPHLRILSLRGLWELEYIEEDEIEARDSPATIAESGAALFFPCLEQLELRDLPKLKGWSTRVPAATSIEQRSLPSFGLLSQLTIINSPKLKSIPLSPCVRKLEFHSMNSELVQQLLSPCSDPPSSSLEDLSITDFKGLLDFPWKALASLRNVYIDHCNRLETLRLLQPNLSTVLIKHCQELNSLEVQSLLQSLKIENCNKLAKLHIAHPGCLEKLFISDCPELKLWDSQRERWPLDWRSFYSLRRLFVDEIPPPDKLPDWVRRRVAAGKLRITAKPIKKLPK